jgi:hypothetical protein
MIDRIVPDLTIAAFIVLIASSTYRTYGSAAETTRPLDRRGFVAALRSAGVKSRSGGPVDQPFFSVPGRFVRVKGEDVQVFEYPDEARARAASNGVSQDGGTVGGSAVMWAGPPHFFRRGRLIVLYVGEDPSVLSPLQRVLGPQFAGR